MYMKERDVARKLGLFSLALGLVEVLAPRSFGRAVGLDPEQDGLVRAFGAREIGAGAGLLKGGETLEPWMWGRVAGDVLDAAVLGSALRRDNPRRANAIVALVAVAGVLAIDVACARVLRRRERKTREGKLLVSRFDESGRPKVVRPVEPPSGGWPAYDPDLYQSGS